MGRIRDRSALISSNIFILNVSPQLALISFNRESAKYDQRIFPSELLLLLPVCVQRADGSR